MNMLRLKPFDLKLLYFGVGILPLIVLAIISQKNPGQNPQNLLWFGLFGFTFMAAALVQHKLRKMGILRLKETGTYAALFIATSIFILLVRQIL
jgi:hypothetical protein